MELVLDVVFLFSAVALLLATARFVDPDFGPHLDRGLVGARALARRAVAEVRRPLRFLAHPVTSGVSSSADRARSASDV